MRVGIAGTGTWATALAQVLTDNGHEAILYGRDRAQIDDINIRHRNTIYFGEKISLSENIVATDEIGKICDGTDLILLCVPTSAMREVLERIKPCLSHRMMFVNTAKGFDQEGGLRMSQLIRAVIPHDRRSPIVSLLGPSHAEEVIIRHLTLICSISRVKKAAEAVQRLFSNSYFRVYVLKDEVGAELSSAIKNCIAIAAGIVEGLGLGDNAKAALITRGLNEMVKFGARRGARRSTYLGLTGLGDLVVTCGSYHSRNFQAGLAIGRADSSTEFLKSNTKTVEGIRTTKILYEMIRKTNLSLPIVEALYKVLFLGEKPSETITNLMSRPLRAEDE